MSGGDPACRHGPFPDNVPHLEKSAFLLFEELLGLLAGEIESLEEEGVIGSTPLLSLHD